MTRFTESAIEETALNWIKHLGYAMVYGGDIVHENTLASLRDGLLPKLMKGEVRVKEVAD